MELGQYQFQLFVTLVMILTAAFVAVIWDFLKRNNEQLRELTVELRGRNQDEQRRAQAMMPRTAAGRVAAAPAAATFQAPSLSATTESKSEKERSVFSQNSAGTETRDALADALAEIERGGHLARAAKVAFTPDAFVPPALMNSHPAPLPIPASLRLTCLLSTPVPAAMMEQLVIDELLPIEIPVIAQQTPVLEQMTAQQPVVVTPEVTTPKKTDWGALLAGRASAATIQPNLPTGFHDADVLTRLILSRQPVTGLVISIGVTANLQNGTVHEPVNGLIRSLIGTDNFASPSGTDEFLLIYPRLNGAAAQRQLNLVAQQLWDFQLRSLGSTSILFSWGGVEVASESIDEAVASASGRMNETRRGRKLVAMPLRQAV